MGNERFKSALQYVQLLFSRGIIRPSRAWLVILSFSSVLIITFLIIGGILFIGVRDGELFISKMDSTDKTEFIDRTLLRDTLASFEKRGQEHSELLRKTPGLVDPSM
jgi:hypothetical protein|tara:strand:- start:3311 stop:3631 length:321 start_codon:yes stop_codon:yes gene_type:complete